MLPTDISSNTLIILISLVFLAISFILIFYAVKTAFSSNKRIEERLSTTHGPSAQPASQQSSHQQDASLLEVMGDHLTLPGPDEIKRIRFQLAQAGFYEAGAAKIFIAARLLSLLVPQFLLIASWGNLSNNLSSLHLLFLAILLAVLGLFGPTWFLSWRQGQRTQQARNGFPDMMDLLVASVEAGLGLDAALMRVTNELGSRYPVLKVNLDLMNLELRAGRERHGAMLNFADRLNLEEAKALAVILRQSEEMGSSLGAALRTFSEDMRYKRMMKAEEKAMALSAKLTVPLIVFIFPAIMVMLMLPAGIRLAAGLSAA